MSEGTPFGSWLKQRRKELGLTQQELAERVECSLVLIVKIEAGQRRPSSQIAHLLAEALGVPVDERQAFLDFARADLPPATRVQLARAGSPAPWRTLQALTVNLPTPPTSFVERPGVVAAVDPLLHSPGTRLLTLSGPPGIGKTRLALHLAGMAAGAFPDGIHFVGLSTIQDPALVLEAVAKTLDVAETQHQALLDSVKAHLRDKRLLLVLDNCEQVLDGTAVIAELLVAAPWLKVLATSREVLHLYGEHHFPVPALTAPTPSPRYLARAERLLEYEALRLFVERARAVQPAFRLTDANAGAVVEICLRLDRLPLAIELAAAHSTLLTPQQILAHLDDRLELLQGGARDVPVRQQTLRRAIDWSYDLLEPAAQRLFRRLAVFVGGWTVAAAQAIVDAPAPPVVRDSAPWPAETTLAALSLGVEPGVDTLLTKNLLTQHSAAATPRYAMLESIREYAREKLREDSVEEAALRAQHTRYYLGLAQMAQGALVGPEQGKWLARLEEEHDNLRAAFDYLLLEEDGEGVLRLSDALWRFWHVHGHLSEGRRRLAAALARGAAAPPALRATVLTAAGNLAWAIGDFIHARPLYEESLALSQALGDQRGMARPLNNLAVLAYSQGDYERAARLFAESLTIKRALGDQVGIASSLNGLGNVEYDWGNYARAEELFAESLARFRELGNLDGTATGLNNLGIAVAALGDQARAAALYQDALRIRQELGDQEGIARLLINLGEVAYVQGNYAAAAAHYEESLGLRRERGDKRGQAIALRHLGGALLHQSRYRPAGAALRQSLRFYEELGASSGLAECLVECAALAGAQQDYVESARLLGTLDALLASSTFHLAPVEQQEYERCKAGVQAALDPVTWRAAWAAGQARTVAQVIADLE